MFGKAQTTSIPTKQSPPPSGYQIVQGDAGSDTLSHK